MNQKAIEGQASELDWPLLRAQLHELLNHPDRPMAGLCFAAAAAGLQNCPRGSNVARSMLLELLLLDVRAAVFLCSPQQARQAWKLLCDNCELPDLDAELQQTALRCRYIAAILLLQAGMLEADSLKRLEPRRGLRAEHGADGLLVEAMLQEALISRNSALAMQACCLARSFNAKPSTQFVLLFRQLSLALLEERARPEQLAELLRAARNYGDWQALDGALWQCCLEHELIPLENWKLHLQAHESCHESIYSAISHLENS